MGFLVCVCRKEKKMDDLISRQAALALAKDIFVPIKDGTVYRHRCIDPQQIMDLPSAQPEIIRCRDCKYFELDHFEKVGGFPIPIIVAHEICMKWGEGCKSSIDGWCFMAERRTND